MVARPFLKWAGGKGQLLSTFLRYYPQTLWDGGIDNYVEPFVGGGAVFLDLVSRCRFSTIVLNDINPDIILAYRVVRDDLYKLVECLSRIQEDYRRLGEEDRKDFFYAVRERFNQIKASGNAEASAGVEFVSYLIFLNRTCFNGLFRLNSRGEFNVPFGAYANPTICDEDNLLRVSEALRGVELTTGDFSKSLDNLNLDPTRTFVYMDPPYRPLPGAASFTSYAASSFNDNSQVRLAQWFTELSESGYLLMLSNSDPTPVDPRDRFFEELYARFNRHKVMATRAINSRASARGAISELLITNYDVESLQQPHLFCTVPTRAKQETCQ